MSAVLRDNQHELAYTDGTHAVVFGTEDTGYLTLTRPSIGAAENTSGDLPRPQEDGIMLSRDFRSAKTITFEMGVLTDALSVGALNPHQANLDYLNALESVWQNEVWRADPRAIGMLRTCEAGRTFRCYGRPRRWEESAGDLTKFGYTPVVADFQLVDDRWYSDVESSVDVPAAAAVLGGFFSPLRSPITTTMSTTAAGFADIGGYKSTWPVVEFHGPITRPELQIGSISIGLNMDVGNGAVITIDTRPWMRTVLRNTDGAGFAGYLSRATPVFRKCLLTPGRYGLTLRGTTSGGGGYARLRWRDARARP